MEVVTDPPPKAAPTVAACEAETAAEVAVNVTELEPAGTVTAAGTLNAELFEVILMTAPPTGAKPLRMTVQVLDPAGTRLDGMQPREPGKTAGCGGTSVTAAVAELPFKPAVRFAPWLLGTVFAFTVNTDEVEPAATVTDSGVARLPLSLLTATTAPPLGAAVLSTAVQVDAPGVEMVAGAQDREVTVVTGPTEIVPPLPDALMGVLAGDAALTADTPRLIEPLETEGVTLTIATAPSLIAPVLTPDAMQP